MKFTQEERVKVRALRKQLKAQTSLTQPTTRSSQPRSLWQQHHFRSPRGAFTLPAYFLPRLWWVFGGFAFWNCAGAGSCSGSLQEVDTSSSSLLLLWSLPPRGLGSASSGSSMPACCRRLRDLLLRCCCLRFSSSCCRCFIFMSFSKLLVVVGFTTNQSYRGKTETLSSQKTAAAGKYKGVWGELKKAGLGQNREFLIFSLGKFTNLQKDHHSLMNTEIYHCSSLSFLPSLCWAIYNCRQHTTSSLNTSASTCLRTSVSCCVTTIIFLNINMDTLLLFNIITIQTSPNVSMSLILVSMQYFKQHYNKVAQRRDNTKKTEE